MMSRRACESLPQSTVARSWPDIVSSRKLQRSVKPFESDQEAGKLRTYRDRLGSRSCSPVSQAFAMQTPSAHQSRPTKSLQPPSNPDESSAAKEGRRETKGASVYCRQFPFHLVNFWSGRSVCGHLGCVGAESSAIDSGPGSWWRGASCSARGS